MWTSGSPYRSCCRFRSPIESVQRSTPTRRCCVLVYSAILTISGWTQVNFIKGCLIFMIWMSNSTLLQGPTPPYKACETVIMSAAPELFGLIRTRVKKESKPRGKDKLADKKAAK